MKEAVQSFVDRPGVVRLLADVQHYAWGDSHFIPALLGIDNASGQPFAELWMGAHPDLPARVLLDGARVPLNELIDRNPQRVLGERVSQQFHGRLPYLFKVLSAAAPLSIQAHPNLQQAQAGFARENAAGIELTARDRNYKDDNHKPELIAALTDFYALRGYRPHAEIKRVLRATPELQSVAPDYGEDRQALETLYEKLMTLPQDQVNAILDPLLLRLTDRHRRRPFARSDHEYWLLRADQTFSEAGRRDRGLFSVLLLNLVHLCPGQALYLSAGVLHAYLEGSGIEIMANSNNVLRGGLTQKHIDVAELLRNVTFAGEVPDILEAQPLHGEREWAYHTPAREFELRRIEVSASHAYCSDQQHSADILLLVSPDGARVGVASAEGTVNLTRGQCCLAPAGVEYRIACDTGNATLYKATVPCQ